MISAVERAADGAYLGWHSIAPLCPELRLSLDAESPTDTKAIEAILGALLPGTFGPHMYVAWFSVSNFVTAGLLPYVIPFDQGVMQRSFDAGLYVMRLMHGSSTAVTCTVLRRLPKERRLA